MKRKLLVLAAVSLLNMQAFSMEIVKGRLIEHKEWSTHGNIKGQIKDLTTKEIKLLPKRLTDPIDSSGSGAIYAKAIINNAFMQVIAGVGDNVNIGGTTLVTINNFTIAPQQYQITREVCTALPPVVSPIPNDGSIPITRLCYVFWDYVQLDSNGMLSLIENPSITFSYAQAGIYNVSVGVTITSATLSSPSNYYFNTDDSTTINVVDSGTLPPLPPKKKA